MKKIALEQLKSIELNILVYIDKVCKENNLRYFLCGGTLLGAVRHEGFIPWDDDIDICMPRPDYDKFVNILKNSDSKYKILSTEKEDYYYNFSKVVDCETILNEYYSQPIEEMGVYVDVFPLEGMPLDKHDRKKHFYKLNKLKKKINSFSLIKPKIRKNLYKYVKTLIIYIKNKNSSLLKYQSEYNHLAKQYKYDNSAFVYITGGAYGEKDIFSSSIFSKAVDIKFEGKMFSAPEKFDDYLRSLYGNYMQLPPIEKRISNHNFEAKYR